MGGCSNRERVGSREERVDPAPVPSPTRGGDAPARTIGGRVCSICAQGYTVVTWGREFVLQKQYVCMAGDEGNLGDEAVAEGVVVDGELTVESVGAGLGAGYGGQFLP